MQAEFSHLATEDLQALYRYGVEKFGIAVAEAYAEGITQAVHLLASQPGIARLRMEFSTPVRIHHWRSHYIVYTERALGIYIVRVLHHGSDITRHLALADE